MCGVAGPDSQAMERELGSFLDVVRRGKLTPVAFVEQLEAIHGRFLGDELNSDEPVKARLDALAAYEELLSDIDRHHQIELLAQALGVDP
jgi:hypothetical protein